MVTKSIPQPLIDCDIHNELPSVKALHPYLSDYWREVVTQSDFRGPKATAYPPGAATSLRAEAKSESDAPPGSSLSQIQAEVLDPLKVRYGILNCAYGAESIHNYYGAAVLVSAVNDWLVAEWLEPEPRLRASLVVTPQQPELAIKEIRRRGDHPGFVQVFLPVQSAIPYGNLLYHPLYEAAVEHGLAIALHFGGAPGVPPTASGWPSHYIELYAGMAQIFQTQIMSLIVEGVFDKFPELRLVLIESGFTWLPGLMWRMDKEWKGLRREIPWVKNLPSDYIRKHMRFTLQPFDAPPNPEQLRQLFEQVGSDELLMFSSDYPHHHDDTPIETYLAELPPELTQKIMVDNAREFYKLNGSDQL